MADRGVDLSALPKEVRDQLAELDLELSEGDITQKGFEKKRAKLLASYIPHLPNVGLSLPDVQLSPGHSSDPSPSPEAPGPSTSSASRHHRTHRSGGARDERYRSDIHTEAVQAALAKHKEEKMALPMPTKRRSAFVQSPIDTCTPPDTSSASEDEGSLRRKAALSAVLAQSLQSPDYWINRFRPKLLHVLIRFLHPLPWRAQDAATAPAPACCFPVGRCTGPHTHRKQCPPRCDILHFPGERVQGGPASGGQGHEPWTEPL